MKRGQSTIEMVTLILIVAIAVFLMRGYIKRAMQGKIKQSADQIGQAWDYSDADPSTTVYYSNYVVDSTTTEVQETTGTSVVNYEQFRQTRNEYINTVEISDDYQDVSAGVW